jgi:hypothetical protein
VVSLSNHGKARAAVLRQAQDEGGGAARMRQGRLPQGRGLAETLWRFNRKFAI